jgi:hypothetical protein
MVAAVTPAVKPAAPVPAPVVAALPVAPPATGLPVGTGLPGQAVDPAALAQAVPAGGDPVRGTATPAGAAKPAVKKAPSGPKKTPPAKPKAKVVDPFD